MTTETSIALPNVDTATIIKALNSIKEYAKSKKYVLTGNVDSLTNLTPTFTSKTQTKKFQWSLLRVINRPSMKNSNMFLSQLSKANGMARIKMEISEQEKSIRAAKKTWKAIQVQAEEARIKYKELKGDFYKC